MAKTKSSRTVAKSIYFTFLLYPESIPSDWKIRLETLGRPIAISPLHDKDRIDQNTLNSMILSQENFLDDFKEMFSKGEITKADLESCEQVLLKLKTEPQFKKPHYHVIYVAKNNVTADSVRKKIQLKLGNQAIAKVQIIATSVRNAYLYLTHESVDAVAKKKHVYSKNDIVLLNNFDVDRYDELDAADKKDMLNTIIDIIKIKGIKNIIDLELFIDEDGDSYGINTKQMRSVIDGKSGLLRLYFDGAYQKSKLEESNLKQENKELMIALKRGNEENVNLRRKLRMLEEK